MMKRLSRRASSTTTFSSTSSSSLCRTESLAHSGTILGCKACETKRNRRWGADQLCRKCASQIKQDFFFDRQTVYRALRSDDDPSKGLFPRNEHAQFSLEDHILYGDTCHSQFLSFSSLPEVAMYFAIERALNQQVWPCQIVQVSLPIASGEPSCGEKCRYQERDTRGDTVYDVMACVDESWSDHGQQQARLYDEICVESSVHHSFIERTFEISHAEAILFKDHVDHVRNFKVQYYKSPVKKRFEGF